MRNPASLGRERHWILEIHLVDQTLSEGVSTSGSCETCVSGRVSFTCRGPGTAPPTWWRSGSGTFIVRLLTCVQRKRTCWSPFQPELPRS